MDEQSRIKDLEDEVQFYHDLAGKYHTQARKALQLAAEWESIATQRQELLEQMLVLVSTRQAVVMSLPTKGEA